MEWYEFALSVMWTFIVVSLWDIWRRKQFAKTLKSELSIQKKRDKDIDEAYTKFKRDYEMVPIHRHPDCTADNLTCDYQDPHKHGFACDASCFICNKSCPATCPAHDSKIEKVVILDKTYPNGKTIKIEAEGIKKYIGEKVDDVGSVA